MDFAGASILLVTLSPVMLVIGLLIRVRMGTGVFFRQVRPGLGEQPFQMVKFRTMSEERDSDGGLAPDRERITRLGRILRATSLDELPQLVNILRGEMSFVGPRPLLTEYLPYYSAEERRRHTVLPGITGLAQVSGRNLLSWDDRLRRDVEYVERLSFRLDLWILWRTVVDALMARGVAVDTSQVEGNLAQQRMQKEYNSGGGDDATDD